METDIVNDSIAIIPHKNVELSITVLNIFAKQVAAKNRTNHPSPLKIVMHFLLKYFFSISNFIKMDKHDTHIEYENIERE